MTDYTPIPANEEHLRLSRRARLKEETEGRIKELKRKQGVLRIDMLTRPLWRKTATLKRRERARQVEKDLVFLGQVYRELNREEL